MRKIIASFDKYIESRISIVLNWLWKSGLLLFVIGLLCQQLSSQRLNSKKIIENSNTIKELLIDIKYLRRDVDNFHFSEKNIKGEQMGDISIANDIIEGVADAMGELGSSRKFRIVTIPSVDITNPGKKPTETTQDVTVDALLFSFFQEYMPDANIIEGGLMSILSIEDFTDAQLASIKPGSVLVDTDNTTTYEIVRTNPIEVAGITVTVVVQLKG